MANIQAWPTSKHGQSPRVATVEVLWQSHFGQRKGLSRDAFRFVIQKETQTKSSDGASFESVEKVAKNQIMSPVYYRLLSVSYGQRHLEDSPFEVSQAETNLHGLAQIGRPIDTHASGCPFRRQTIAPR